MMITKRVRRRWLNSVGTYGPKILTQIFSVGDDCEMNICQAHLFLKGL